MIKIADIVLIIVGALALAYQEFTYTDTKQVAQIGSLNIQDNETKSIPLPPIVGGVFVAALFLGSRKA
jgi:hypothetical protein